MTNNDAQGNGFYAPIVSYEVDSVWLLPINSNTTKVTLKTCSNKTRYTGRVGGHSKALLLISMSGVVVTQAQRRIHYLYCEL